MDDGSGETAVVLCFDLKAESGNDGEKAVREAIGRAQWMEAFWFSTQRRKHPSLDFSIRDGTQICITSSTSTTDNYETKQPQDTNQKFQDDWNKQIRTALKKIIVEDFGDLQAQELKETIPDEDKDGRGLNDLAKLERQLSVKVIFLQHHILLVGAKSKLEKKTFVIRNMLQHYHWRLTGKEIKL